MSFNGKCGNCGINGHTRRNCPQPIVKRGDRKNAKCFKCGSKAHLAENCDVGQICYKCKQAGHIAENCPILTNTIPSEVKLDSSSSTIQVPADVLQSLLLEVQKSRSSSTLAPERSSASPESEIKNEPLKLPTLPDAVPDGFVRLEFKIGEVWGHNSWHILEGSDFFKLKNTLTSRLLEKGIITEDDMDRQNKTPHIDLKGNKSHRDQLDGIKIDVNMKTIKFDKKTIEIEITPEIHYTLLFKRKLDTILTQVKPVLHSILVEMGLPNTESKEEQKNEDDTLCCICFDKPKQYANIACGHKCLCEDCSKVPMDTCPMCRTKVQKFIKIY